MLDATPARRPASGGDPQGGIMGESSAGPVVLATLGDRPFDSEAVTVAVDIAREHGTWLAVVDLVDMAPAARSGPRDLGPPPATAASLDAAVAQARAADVPVTAMRGGCLHPPGRLADLVVEHSACLLVFGPGAASRRLSGRRRRRIVRLLERRTACLIWTAGPPSREPRGRVRRAAATVAGVARQWPPATRRAW
jgi:hypothetical protein